VTNFKAKKKNLSSQWKKCKESKYRKKNHQRKTTKLFRERERLLVLGIIMIKSAEDEFFENFHLYIRAYFPADLDNNMPKEQ